MTTFKDAVNTTNETASQFWGSQGPLGKRWVVGILAFAAGTCFGWWFL